MTLQFPPLDRFIPDSRGPRALGCTGCRFIERCGGIQDRSQRFSCFDRCTFQCSPGCGNACPKNPSFDARVGQVGGLLLDNVPSAPRRRIPKLPVYVPLIDHEYLCSGRIPFDAVAIPLRRLVRVKARDCRFASGEELRAALGLSMTTKVIALGIAKDLNLENLWGIRYEASLFEELSRLRLAGVSAPNYSSFLDQPRTEDMVNQKRMLLYAYRLQKAGIAAALHWNIYFERDFDFHESFLRNHEEYDTISIEFGSGLRSTRLASFFVDRLVSSIGKVARPLRLISKGGVRHLAKLKQAFSSVAFIDSTPFQLARCRQRLFLGNNGKMITKHIDARTKQEVRELFEANARTREGMIRNQLAIGT